MHRHLCARLRVLHTFS